MLFKDLSSTAKENAIQNIRELGWTVDEGWWDYIYKDATTYLSMLGFDVIEFSFSGFYSQGDGASFDAVFNSRGIDTAKLKEYSPEVYEKIRETYGLFFEETGAPKDAWVEAQTKVTGYRPYTSYEFVDFEIDDPALDEDEIASSIDELLESGIDENDERILKLRRMFDDADTIKSNIEKWIADAHEVLTSMLYQSLQVEYEWLTSDEVIQEHIEANEIEFDENGLM